MIEKNNIFGKVYLITNLITKKHYVGQTTNSDCYKRVIRHFNTKPANVSLIYRTIKKYGKNNFTWKELVYCFSRESLDCAEKQLIASYNCIHPNGYNLVSGGIWGEKEVSKISHKRRSVALKKTYADGRVHPFKGKKLKESHIDSLSRVRKGFDSLARKKAREKIHENSRIKIIATKIDTGVSFEFNSIANCAKTLSLSAPSISRTLRNVNNIRQHKGYMFRYKVKDNFQLPLKPISDTYCIHKNNKVGYTVTIRKKYIGWAKTIDDAKKLRDNYITCAENHLSSTKRKKK